MKRHILVGAFGLLSLALFFWVLGNLYAYGMAEFDCADMTVNVAECAKPIKVQAALSIASTIAVKLPSD